MNGTADLDAASEPFGIDAYSLRGGIAAWQAQGLPVADKGTPPAAP